jgi:ribokinase
VCALGDDAGGATARELAAQDGFALIAEASSEPTGTAGIYVDARGRNTIVIGPAPTPRSHRLPATAAGPDRRQGGAGAAGIAGADHEAALATAREAGVTTVLNTAPADAPTIGLLKLADVITPNETEFAALLGRHVGERVDANDVAALDGASLHALCRKLVGNGTVVVTLGSVGVFVSHPTAACAATHQPHYRVVPNRCRPSTPPVPVMPSTVRWPPRWHRWPMPRSPATCASPTSSPPVRPSEGAALAMPRLAELDVTV